MRLRSGQFTKWAMVVGIVLVGGLVLVQVYAGLRKLQQSREAGPVSALEQLRRQVPDFQAVDQDGRVVTPESLRGKVWVAGFVFTRCLGPCPLITRRMAEIQELVRDLPEVRLVSFSVDPAHDTPEVLKAYAQTHGALPGKWLFLTGEPEAQLRLVREGFLTAVQPVEGSDQVIHGTMVAVVDAAGEIRGFYDGLSADTPEKVAARVRALHGR
jgi:protein SCO1/2